MSKHTGQDRRKGGYDRRKKSLLAWSMLILLFFLLGGAAGYATRASGDDTEDFARADSVMNEKLDDAREELQRLASSVPDTVVRVVVRERIIRDTLTVTKTVEVASPPQIVEVETIVSRVDTFYAPPQIIRIDAPARNFWSSETYKPSIGNTVWSVGGFLLGVLVGGQIDNDAKACVIINGEERCNY